jgi:hypothetical protein
VILGNFLVLFSGIIVGFILYMLINQMRQANKTIDKILHYEVELSDNHSICHECGEAYPCSIIVKHRS